MKKLLCYKLAARFNGQLSSKDVVKLHLLHAEANDGRVLFTINKFPQGQYQEQIKEIILTSKDGMVALRADVDDLGKFIFKQPPTNYSVPSVWNNEPTKDKGWFALSNIRPLIIQKGDFYSVNGIELLDSIKGNAYMVYIALNDMTQEEIEKLGLSEERRTELQEDVAEYKRLLDEMYYGEYEGVDETFVDTDEIIDWYDSLSYEERRYVYKFDQEFVNDIDDWKEAKNEKELSL